MGMQQPARVPAGVRAGGQFASDPRPDAGVVLSPAVPSYAERVPLTDADLDKYFYDDTLPVRDRFQQLAKTLADKHPFEVGRTRIVFHTDTDVMKVPLTSEGLDDSDMEAFWSGKYGKSGYIPIATSQVELIDDLPVLRMERVRMPTETERRALPDWTGSVDCAQVGYTSAGELVAFDL
jgi:hypothetical protein